MLVGGLDGDVRRQGGHGGAARRGRADRRARSNGRRCVSSAAPRVASSPSSRFPRRAARRLWRRYVRIGLGLLLVYGLTAGGLSAFVFGGYALAGNSAILLGWTVAAALASSALIVWITILNFFYLMTQMVVAIEDVSVRTGVRLALRSSGDTCVKSPAVFGVVLVVVVIATAASILATAGLGLIAFVPLVGLAVLPLQLAAWLLRGIVFEYLALAALGAYLSHYRWYHRGAEHSRRCARSRTSVSHDQLRSVSLARRRKMKESAIRQMGTVLAAGRDIISFAPGYPAPDTFPWAEFREIARRAARRRATAASCSTGRRAATGRCSRPSPRSCRRAAIATDARGAARHDRLAAGARSRRARAARSRRRDPGRAADLHRRDHGVPQRAGRRWSACRRKPTASISTRSTRRCSALRAAGRRVKFLYVVPNFQNPTGLLIGLEKRRAAARVGRAPRRADRRGRSVPRAAIFEDSASEADVRPIKADDADGRVIYLSSFSKTLAPGYRVAWIAAPPALAAKFEMAKQAADLLHRIARSADRLRGVPARTCSIASCRCCARTTQHKRDVMERGARAANSAGRSSAGRSRKGGFFLWLTLPARHRRRRDDPARRRARGDLRRGRGVLRRTAAGAATRCGCRSPRRHPSGSKRASRGWRRRSAPSSQAATSESQRPPRHHGKRSGRRLRSRGNQRPVARRRQDCRSRQTAAPRGAAARQIGRHHAASTRSGTVPAGCPPASHA